VAVADAGSVLPASERNAAKPPGELLRKHKRLDERSRTDCIPAIRRSAGLLRMLNMGGILLRGLHAGEGAGAGITVHAGQKA